MIILPTLRERLQQAKDAPDHDQGYIEALEKVILKEGSSGEYRLTDGDLCNIKYFWEKKQDITSWVGWDRVKDAAYRDFPVLMKAWDNYNAAHEWLDAVVTSVELPPRSDVD